MTGLEIAEERERDASRQRQRQEREAAANAVADLEHEAEEERRMLEADWVADTQLQLSQLSYVDADNDHEPLPSSQSSPSDNQPHKAELSDSDSLQASKGFKLDDLRFRPTASPQTVNLVDLDASRSSLL